LGTLGRDIRCSNTRRIDFVGREHCLGSCCGGPNKLPKAGFNGVRDRLVLLGFGECIEHAGCGLKRRGAARAGVKVRLDHRAVGGGEGPVEQSVRMCTSRLAAARGTASGGRSLRENLNESRPCALDALVGSVSARAEQQAELRRLPALTVMQNHGQAVLDRQPAQGSAQFLFVLRSFDDGAGVGDVGQHRLQRIRSTRGEIAPAALAIDDRPGEDAAKPGACRLLIAKLTAGAPRTLERVLDRPLALVLVACEPPRKQQEPRELGGNTRGKRVTYRVAS
jgi:hypothetical protein